MIEDESDGAFLFTHKDSASNSSSHLGSMSARALSLCPSEHPTSQIRFSHENLFASSIKRIF